MGIYSETLLEKERHDIELERNADKIFRKWKKGDTALDPMEQTKNAVRTILRYFRIDSQDVNNCKTTEEVLDALLDPEGIMYEKINLLDKQWKKQSNFILAFFKDGVPVILRPSLFGYNCECPSNVHNTRGWKIDQLEPYAYAVYRPLNDDGFSVWRFIRLMMHFISPGDILYIAAATFFVTVLGLVAPAVNKYVLQDLLEKGPAAYSQLIVMAFVFFVAGLLKGVFSILKIFLLSRMKLRISTQMQTAVVSKVLLMPYDYFLSKSVGKQSVQIRSTQRLTGLLLDFFLGNLFNVFFSVAYIPQMSKLAPQLLVPSLLVLVVQMVVSVLLCLASAKNTAELLNFRQDSDGLAFELIKGIQKIRGVGAENRAYYMAATRQRKVLDASLNPPIWVRLNVPILSLISSFGTILVLLLAAVSGVSQAEYISFTSSFGLLSSSVNSMISMSKEIIAVNPLINQMRQLFDYKSTVPDGRRYVSSLRGDISIEGLCFSYTFKGNQKCVDNIDLHIRQGEKVAFVGESGCGKSTLLKLILGLLIPDAGTILFDGCPISTFNQRSFRKRIGSVFQFSRVFPGTIFDNIAFTAPGITPDEAWAAAEAACIAEDIKKLPMGLETEISEGNGGGFSGGQKQRILLARAFAQKPSVLILDEATSALDNISQHHVLSSVYSMPCTVLMVAHRLSTVKGCDRIIVLKDGQIVEQGDYNSLIEKNGEFARLVRKQQ